MISTRSAGLLIALLAAPVGGGSAGAAPDCDGSEPFACLRSYAETELKRFHLEPNADQTRSIRSIEALRTYREDGIEAAVKAFEKEGLPLYDLLFALAIARQGDDAKAVTDLATGDLGIYDGEGLSLSGEDALAQLKKDVFDWYSGRDGEYLRLCKAEDDAFKAEIRASLSFRDGACKPPFDPLIVRRFFALLQLRMGLSSSDAFRAAMEFAFKNTSCEVATSVLDVLPSWKMLGDDAEVAVWRIIDTATLCAAIHMQGMRL